MSRVLLRLPAETLCSTRQAHQSSVNKLECVMCEFVPLRSRLGTERRRHEVLPVPRWSNHVRSCICMNCRCACEAHFRCHRLVVSVAEHPAGIGLGCEPA